METSTSDLHPSAELGLAYRIRQPAPLQPTRCVVLLHGVGGNESNLLDLASGLDAQTLVILPRGPLQLGAQQFAWFSVAFTPSGPSIVEQEAESARKALIRFVQGIQARHGIATQRTVIAGFSQGGIVSASVALSAPECVAGFAILSGRILPELKPHIAAEAKLQHLGAFIGHGERDSKLPVVWAQRSDQLLNELGVKHRTCLYPIDHTISAAMRDDFRRWLQGLLAPAAEEI